MRCGPCPQVRAGRHVPVVSPREAETPAESHVAVEAASEANSSPPGWSSPPAPRCGLLLGPQPPLVSLRQHLPLGACWSQQPSPTSLNFRKRSSEPAALTRL